MPMHGKTAGRHRRLPALLFILNGIIRDRLYPWAMVES